MRADKPSGEAADGELASQDRRFQSLDSLSARSLPATIQFGTAAFDGAFTPSLPRGFGPLFVGRQSFLRRLMTAVQDERVHVVLYGDRGVGKTSLTKAFGELAKRSGYTVLRRSCGASTTYDGLFRSILDSVHSRTASGAGLPKAPMDVEQVVDAFAASPGSRLLIFFDEFDRAEEDDLRSRIAETIKSLSDRAAQVNFVIVGVAASMNDLIGRHPSIQRNVAGVHLTPMSAGEIRQLIDVGAKASGFEFTSTVSRRIAGLARGMPYYAHSLCLHSLRAAMARKERVVTEADLEAALLNLLEAQDPELLRLYEDTTAKLASVTLLEKMAAACHPQQGFSALDIGATDIELSPLASEDFNSPLRRTSEKTPGRYLLQPMFAHFVLLRGATAGRFPAADKDVK